MITLEGIGLAVAGGIGGAATRRWELGSEFHYMPGDAGPAAGAGAPWDEAATCYGSGRDALRALVRHGRSRRGWKRIWLPTYYCPEVAASLADTGVAVRFYADGPLQPAAEPPAAEPGDVVLECNTFGLRSRPAAGPAADGVDIVEDHTHDPWSDWAQLSRADWCFASLRKALPVPDGAVLWSPRRHRLPPAPAVTPQHEQAAMRKLAAMVLKALYLDGFEVDKSVFRALSVVGEAHIAAADGAESGMTRWSAAMLGRFPLQAWRERRRENHRALRDAVADLPWLRVLGPGDDHGSCPFSVVLVLRSEEHRDVVRRGLLGSAVYPAILWPLDGSAAEIPRADRALSRRLLSVSCDMRYDARDMERVAWLLRGIGARLGRIHGHTPIPAPATPRPAAHPGDGGAA
ncbi:MAG TPA: hypothetical protein VFQ38_02440 [Longimicrobiales bacterium]|nr:hypothetical protein [Longimicrobiales bacterium]